MWSTLCWDTRVDSQAWLGDGTSKWRWVSKPDDFESRFYGIQIWNFHLEVLDTDQGWLAKDLKSALPFSKLQDMVQLFLQRAPWAHGYVATEVVYEEPLFQVLSEAGFEQVEHRCLYKSNVSQLRIPQDKSDHSIQYRSLAAIAANQRDRIREQILEICRESFHQGYSRHFSDRFLVQRAPGSAYILDVM